MSTSFAQAVCDLMETGQSSINIEPLIQKYDLSAEEVDVLKKDHAEGRYLTSLKMVATGIDAIHPEIKQRLNELVAKREAGVRAGIPCTGMC